MQWKHLGVALGRVEAVVPSTSNKDQGLDPPHAPTPLILPQDGRVARGPNKTCDDTVPLGKGLSWHFLTYLGIPVFNKIVQT